MIYPNPESALDEEAGKQLLADYEGYSKVRVLADMRGKRLITVRQADDFYSRDPEGKF